MPVKLSRDVCYPPRIVPLSLELTRARIVHLNAGQLYAGCSACCCICNKLHGCRHEKGRRVPPANGELKETIQPNHSSATLYPVTGNTSLWYKESDEKPLCCPIFGKKANYIPIMEPRRLSAYPSASQLNLFQNCNRRRMNAGTSRSRSASAPVSENAAATGWV